MIRVPTMIIATTRADRIRGHATMAAWAAAWPVAGALIAGGVAWEAVR